MANLYDLARYADNALNSSAFVDYCPNGLQIEGKHEVARLISGVTASQQLIDAAVAAQADAIIVHHGFFWKNEIPTITGIKRRRIAALLQHKISLLAYHLPLDAHLQWGNNAMLAQRLGLHTEGVVTSGPGKGILFYGRLPQALPVDVMLQRVQDCLQRPPLHIAAGAPMIETLAWCSGAAQHLIDEAAKLGVDGYLSGEVSEQTTHSARENGLHYFAAGHHATERYGVAAFGGHLAERFSLAHTFIDIENPV